MGRETDPSLWATNEARLCYGQVILTHVHAARTHEEGYIGPIIHDEAHSIS